LSVFVLVSDVGVGMRAFVAIWPQSALRLPARVTRFPDSTRSPLAMAGLSSATGAVPPSRFPETTAGADVGHGEEHGGETSGAATPGFVAPPVAASLEQLTTKSKVPPALVAALFAKLQIPSDAPLEQVACVPLEDVQEEAKRVELDGQPISVFQRGQLSYFWKTLMAEFAERDAAPSVAAPAPAITEADKAPKKRMNEVLDQVDDAQFVVLPATEVAKLRAKHRLVTGGDPPDDERPTTEHLSALKQRIDDGEAPYVDFAIFGPYGRRNAKLLRFTAQVFVNGELASKQLRGPSNFAGWKSSWAVFRAAMIMLGAAPPASLDRYARGIQELTILFPQAWGVIAMADETMRSERWAELQESEVGNAHSWGDILWHSAYGSSSQAHWWFMHVVGPLTTTTGAGATRKVAEVEGRESSVPAPPFYEPRPTVPAGFQRRPKKTGGKGGGKSGGKGGGKGGGKSLSKAGPCNAFNEGRGACRNPNCPYKHICRGCGASWPFATCRKCNPAGAAAELEPTKKKRTGARGGAKITK